jgi:2-succinyl-5-enolpyruvyl-6-hydroxy-3-cyclohexene-1-carboxylate synthase
LTEAFDTYLLLRAFVQELTRCGMLDVCTSPGSRCTPLVLTLAREPGLRCHSHIDERCAGFFALGAAKASGRPVAVTCTSGSAVAELLPAVIEAREAGVPLLILSADRPPELRENGAGQAIDQIKLFGDAPKWFFEVGSHDASEQRLRWIRTLACRAYWRALEGRPGVVHLNFPLREPLVIDASSLPSDDSARRDGAPYVRRTQPRPRPSEDQLELSRLIQGARRGVLVCGRDERGDSVSQAAAFCEALSWPLLADPLSGARRGQSAIAHYDALLRERSFAQAQRPDVVLRVGDLPTSKPLREWLADQHAATHVAIDPEDHWQDPAGMLEHSLALDPAGTLLDLTSNPGGLAAAEPSWLAAWRAADQAAAGAIGGVLAGAGLSEPAVATELGVLLPAEATLFVASSMPVRDIETFWPVRADPPRVLCNRGANGIDGTVSSAFGAAAAGDGPVVLLIGDVALAHDIGGLLASVRLSVKLTIVLLDNAGGGIFDFLEIAQSTIARQPLRGGAADALSRGSDIAAPSDQDIYTQHIATPTGLDFALAAKLYGLTHERVQDLQGFRLALERQLEDAGSGIVEVRGDRAENVGLHRRVWEAVAGAIASQSSATEAPR